MPILGALELQWQAVAMTRLPRRLDTA